MKHFRTRVAAIAVVLIVLMGLFPPWSVTGGNGSNFAGVTFSLGYHPIFSAPLMGEISIERLLFQWLLVALIAAAAVFFQSSLVASLAFARLLSERILAKVRAQLNRVPRK